MSGKIDKQFIARFLPASPIIVDTGTFNGDNAIEMTTLWPSAKIHAFEPLPGLQNFLKERFIHYSNIHLHSLALSNKNGMQKLYIISGKSIASSSLLPPTPAMKGIHNKLDFIESVDVPTMTLDSWADSPEISHIDLLWLDMQGMEPQC